MRRPNKPTKRKQRRNAFGQFAGPKPKPVSREWTVRVREPATFRKGETIDRRSALQVGLERGQTLPEPMPALVHQPIQRTLWRRLWEVLRGRA